tara:strand:- start:206 stop:385 length:180 start_codon:yes stop_codon:yes gene_type:complete
MKCCESLDDLILAIIQESKARDWTPEHTTEKVIEIMKEKCEQAKTKCCWKQEERNRASP